MEGSARLDPSHPGEREGIHADVGADIDEGVAVGEDGRQIEQHGHFVAQ